jgi:hypothetical protein
MAKGKNKKRNTAKRKQRTDQKKKFKRKLKLIKLRGDQERLKIIERPPLSEMEAPEGFRTISMSQALMEYAKPLLERTESEEDMKVAYQAATLLWNYSISLKKLKNDPELATMKDRILAVFVDEVKMDEDLARALVDMMVARHNRLFPDEIQPRGTPFMFIRKEASHLIQPIEEARIQLRQDPVAPDEKEVRLLDDLGRLDALVDQGADWDDIEKLLSPIKDAFVEAFRVWLSSKGLEDRLANEFADCLLIWFDFIYAYGHDEETRLDDVPTSVWIEFFHDFLLRKMMVDPPLYVHWPPALRLFYQYLYERGYLEDPHETERLIREIEPDFYDLLRQQFS